MSQNAKPINEEERGKLIDFFKKILIHEDENVVDYVRQAYIGKFDSYITGCPGFAGKLYFIVWDSSPAAFDVVAEQSDGSLFLQGREHELCAWRK